MLKKIIFYPILLVNLIVSVGFLLSGFSYKLPPTEYPILSLANFMFPAFAVGVFFFLFFWLFVKWKYSFLSFLTLILGYIPMHKYAPFSQKADKVESTLSLITYNVHSFHSPGEFSDSSTVDLVIDYLAESKADIVCLQEAHPKGETLEKLQKHYKYIETFTEHGSSPIACLSKTPIERVEKIEYESHGNRSACFYIRFKGQLLRIINNHFETVGLEHDDKEEFKSIVEGAIENDEYKQEGVKRIAKSISKAMGKRQLQAESVAKFIGDNTRNTLALGDFNDTPLSYTHYLIDQKLTDCYAERGRFTGFSYEQNDMHVRIDHAFCSEDFEVVDCYIDDKATFSDHYPLKLFLKRSNK